MVRYFAPPPTRFGSGNTAQAKTKTGAGVVGPPPTKFGQVPPVQAKRGAAAQEPAAAPAPATRPSPQALWRPPAATAAVVQAMLATKPTFTIAGTAALARVCAITGESTTKDPFAGFTYGVWMPTGKRIGFNGAIRQWVINNTPRDDGTPTGWIHCPYCLYEYPENRIEVDHIVDWAAYSMNLTTAVTLNNALAWHVYVGCNDPANLRCVCGSCNASKRDRAVTTAWLTKRQTQANLQGGF